MDAPSPLPSSSSSLLPIFSLLVEPPSLPTSSSSHPQDPSGNLLPSLPMELKREILRFCDPSTLAKTSLVSMAFLDMSSPLLYRDVSIRGWEQLVKLLWVRKRQQPQIDDYLSLEQVQHLTYIHLPSQQESPPLFRSSPLRISSLTIEFDDHDVGDPPSSSLVHLFDPLTLNLRGPIPKSSAQLPRFSVTPLVRWTRLQTLTVRNAQLSDVLASRWFSSLEGPLTIEMNLLDGVIGAEPEEWDIFSTQLELIMCAAGGSWTRVKVVPTWLGVLRVLLGSKEEAERFREKVNERKAFWAGLTGCGVVEETFEKIEMISVSSSTQPRT